MKPDEKYRLGHLNDEENNKLAQMEKTIDEYAAQLAPLYGWTIEESRCRAAKAVLAFARGGVKTAHEFQMVGEA